VNVIQRVCFVICGVVGLFIAGLLGYYGEHMSLRVVLLGLTLSAITLLVLFFFIEKRLKTRQ